MATMATTSQRAIETLADAAAASDVTCSFVSHNCDHETIFRDVYLRTNRTNHTKIMRCFPHCCPTHRKRSYCGSPMHFEMFTGTLDLQEEDVVVYGRFRPLGTPPLAVGARISLDEIEGSLQANDPSEGEWVESQLVEHKASKNFWLFEVNPSGRWYYPWSGAATIAMRGTEHAFETLAFRRHGMKGLELIGCATSPKFRLMSFRRGMGNKASKETADGSDLSPRSSPHRSDTTRAPSPTMLHKATHLNYQQDARFKVESGSPVHLLRSTFLPHDKYHNKRPRREEQDVAYTRSYANDHRVEHSPHSPQWSETRVGDTLSLLLLWLQETPASAAGSRWMLSWERMVYEAANAHILASREGGFLRSGLVPLLSALEVGSMPPQTGSSNLSSSVSPLDAIDAAVRVILHEWLDIESARASYLAIARSTSAEFFPSRQDLADSYTSWVRDAETRAKRFLQSHTHASWMHLVGKTSNLHRHSRQQNANEFSYRAFLAQSRHKFISQNQDSTMLSPSHKRRRSESTLPLGLEASARVWSSRMEDVAIVMDDVARNPLTLLTIMQFWRHLSCIRLDYSSSGCGQLSIASVFNTTIGTEGYTKLVLDGKHRWFSSLPSGLATAGTSLMGYIVGDYVAHQTSVGTIHITTFLWPSAVSDRTETLAYAWHWTVDAASLSSESLTISLVIESARVQPRSLPSAFETMTITEKLRSISRWQHLCQAQLVYHAH